MVDDDPHAVRFPRDHVPAWQVVYWRGGVASGAKDADRAVLEVWTPGHGYSRVAEYDMPDTSGKLVSMLNALDRAHAAGMSARSAQISSLLKH